MATSPELVVFTLVPIGTMVAMIVYGSAKVYELDDRRPILLIALLALMTLHQLTEISQFASGTYYRTTSPTTDSAGNWRRSRRRPGSSRRCPIAPSASGSC